MGEIWRRDEDAAVVPEALADSLPQIVWAADETGAMTYFNRRWYEYTGLTEAESLGRAFAQALHPRDRTRTLRRWDRALREAAPFDVEFRLTSRSDDAYRWHLAHARPVLDELGRVMGWAGTCIDIDERKRFEDELRRHAAELKRSRAELAHVARHDGLTGLPNRALFEDRLQHALATADRHGLLVAVYFVDLDGFKRVNDTLGHAAGDVLLRAVARRLERTLRGSDTVARLGGDEFVALAGDLEKPEDALPLARKLLAHLTEPYELGEHQVRITASIGVSIYPNDADGGEAMLRHADVAMYGAKQRGKNDVRFFAAGMDAAAQERMIVARHLEGALERREMAVHYQPQWNVCSGEIRGFEALIRWTSGALGVVPPAAFVPIAEENGGIAALNAWVLDEGCQQAAGWSRACGRPIGLAVNVSLAQLDRDEFVAAAIEALGRHGLQPGQLELEIGGRTALQDLEAARERMTELRALGVRLTMDDFGAPGSSIDHVLRLPLDGLKIDRGVVAEIGRAEAAGPERVYGALVGLGNALGLEVVASGIETEVQRRALMTYGCQRMQGYLLGSPMPSEEVASWLARRAGALRP
jgi:diguanylate cyclase